MSTKVRYTTRQMMAGFAVSDMTIWTWRQGSSARAPLPIEQEGRNVYFPHAGVVAWAKKHGLTFDATKAAAVTTSTAKPGPKATPAKKVPAKKSAAVKKAATAVKAKRKPKVARAPLANKDTAGPVAAHV